MTGTFGKGDDDEAVLYSKYDYKYYYADNRSKDWAVILLFHSPWERYSSLIFDLLGFFFMKVFFILIWRKAF